MDTGVFCTAIPQLGRRLLFSKARNMSTGPWYYAYSWCVHLLYILACLFCFNRNVEKRQVPGLRDDKFVRRAVGVATEKNPFCGHKSAPLLAKWPHYSWYRMNVPEIMHGKDKRGASAQRVCALGRASGIGREELRCVCARARNNNKQLTLTHTVCRCEKSVRQHRSIINWKNFWGRGWVFWLGQRCKSQKTRTKVGSFHKHMGGERWGVSLEVDKRRAQYVGREDREHRMATLRWTVVL